MGVARGGMVTKLYQFHNLPPILPILQKRLSEHGDVIETQTVRIPQSRLANWSLSFSQS